jgi:hypothetical protein
VRDATEVQTTTLTVVFDGPGAVTGGPSGCMAEWSGDGGVCRWTYPRGAIVTLRASERAPGAYQTWVGCAVEGTDCTLTMIGDRTVTVRFDPVRSYAPRAHFHTREDYGAEDPDRFFSRASLYWFNGDFGRHRKPCRDGVDERVKIASASELTVRRLMQGRFRYRFCERVATRKGGGWKTRRETVDSRQLSAPAAKDHSEKRPRGRAGFYLDLPKRHWHGVRPPKSDSAVYKGPAMHYELRPKRWIVFWFFFAYNQRRLDTHQGDWEHLAVRLDDRNLSREAAYYNHYCGADRNRWDVLRSNDRLVDGLHPIAYIADGGHGIWPTPGTDIETCNGNGGSGFFDRRSKGPRWDTWTRKLVDVTANGWYGAGVGWGKEGGIGWGPLAPGPWKDNVTPADW